MPYFVNFLINTDIDWLILLTSSLTNAQTQMSAINYRFLLCFVHIVTHFVLFLFPTKVL